MGNKSTNGLATFAVRRTWRLRSSDITYRHRDSLARCRGAVSFPIGLQSGSHGRIGQILQAPRVLDLRRPRALPFFSLPLDQGFYGVSSWRGNRHRCCRRCYLRFNRDARLVNKRAAGTAHRRFSKWRYYADLPSGSILEREKEAGRARGKNGRARFSGKVAAVACKPGEIFAGLFYGSVTCAGGNAERRRAHVRARRGCPRLASRAVSPDRP